MEVFGLNNICSYQHWSYFLSFLDPPFFLLLFLSHTKGKSLSSFPSRSFLLSPCPSLTALSCVRYPTTSMLQLCADLLFPMLHALVHKHVRGTLIHTNFPEKLWKFLPSCHPFGPLLFVWVHWDSPFSVLLCWLLSLSCPHHPVLFASQPFFSLDWRLTSPFNVISTLKLLCMPAGKDAFALLRSLQSLKRVPLS